MKIAKHESKIQEVTEEIRKYKLRCGEILRLGFSAESQLEYFIRDYFDTKEHSKAIQLHYWVIAKLSFERKIQILKKICKDNKIDEEKSKKISEAFRFIQRKRNMVAHQQSFIPDTRNYKVFMHPKSEIWGDKDMTEISDMLVNDVGNKNGKINILLSKISKILKSKRY